jgi:hypothetical protein
MTYDLGNAYAHGIIHEQFSLQAQELMELYLDVLWYWEIISDQTNMFWDRVPEKDLPAEFDACVAELGRLTTRYFETLDALQLELRLIQLTVADT